MFSYTIGCAFRAFPDSFSFSCHETAPTAKNKQGRETVIIMIYKHPEIQSSSSSLGDHGDWFLQISHQVKKRSLPWLYSLKNLLNAGIRSVLFLCTCEANPIAVRTSSSSSSISSSISSSSCSSSSSSSIVTPWPSPGSKEAEKAVFSSRMPTRGAFNAFQPATQETQP